MLRVCLSVVGVVILGLGASSARAQIYTCTAEDGTRIFSDERCGPDAKVVKGISTSKKRGQRTPREIKSPVELESLLAKCNAGDLDACKAWTHGGGPGYLREQEKQHEVQCEAGSLAACELRYCQDGITPECRSRVAQAARVSGPNWYLREDGQRTVGESTFYEVRCLPEARRESRDITIACSGPSSPDRCSGAGTTARFARLDQAAAALCR